MQDNREHPHLRLGPAEPQTYPREAPEVADTGRYPGFLPVSPVWPVEEKWLLSVSDVEQGLPSTPVLPHARLHSQKRQLWPTSDVFTHTRWGIIFVIMISTNKMCSYSG